MTADPAAAPDTAQDWSAWVGRSETVRETIAADRVAALAATLDLEQAPAAGAPLPPGWHWIFFNPMVRRSGLGPDGHPRRGGFLPPVTLPRRMWAGGRIAYPGALVVGQAAEKTSVITAVRSKSGRTGQLVFVTVTHTMRGAAGDCVVEEQDIVYRAPSDPHAPAPPPTPAPADAAWTEAVSPDPTLLFRYSALTANGHRIHYDQRYAREEEGYPDLVVHGPLIATLLHGFAIARSPGRRLARFEFRGVHPLFVTAPFALEGTPAADGTLELWARGPDDELVMQASAVFAA